MSQSHRLSGGLIDRHQPLSFRFDGRTYGGFAGDTLASALVANGVKLVGRSFKYHRPRGLLTAGSEEPNGLVELRTGSRLEPNTKAPTVELFDGLVARSQNRWPSLAFDLLSVNQLISPLLVGGFYYKTFMWPAALWEKLYEPVIRRAAGLGSLSMQPDPDSYEKAYAFCDVLVIGGGPAGLAAALAAGASGARVILCDEDFRLGGRLLSERLEVDGLPGAAWAARAETRLLAMPEVTVLRRTQVFGTYDSGQFGALERVCDHLPVPPPHQPRQRMWKIHAKSTVVAAGALERPLVFGGNDTPGVMTASAVRTYVNRYAAAPGRRMAVFTTTDDGWRAAADLMKVGVELAGVIDARAEVSPEVAALAPRYCAMLGARVTDAYGGKALKRIEVVSATGAKRSFEIDALAVSGGWNPQIALTTHTGSKPVWSEAISSFVPGQPPQGMRVAGAANGQLSLGACLAGGARAGQAAAEEAGFAFRTQPVPRAGDEPCAVSPLWRVKDSRTKAFVDFQQDVTTKDVEISALEGFRSVEHLKRYTTLGMATDQGKTSNVNGHALMAEITGRTVTETGTTMSRPPHLPIAIGALAGDHRDRDFRPVRRTAGHAWAAERGAVFVDAGQWKRAQWFPLPGEKDWLESVTREVETVRSAVGVCDVSTLGKIEVQGPEAGAFLDRVYINNLSTLAVGKTRYGVMLREDGIVLDDGTVARFAEDRYFVSTTTANAARIMQHLEYASQVIWPELDVQLSSATEQWAQYAVAGPKARALLERLFEGEGVDLSNAAFPFMACAELKLGEVGVRLFRISFSGELAYEVAAPAHYGHALIRALMAAGEPLGVIPYGTEALGVMRIEKGHVAGNELSGQTTAGDLGLGRMMSSKKDYIGRVLSQRPGLVDPARPSVIGVKPLDPSQRLRAGGHLLKSGAARTADNDEGYLTSVAYSPCLGSWIGLGLLSHAPSRHGEVLTLCDPVRGVEMQVQACSPVFVDPEGTRLHG